MDTRRDGDDWTYEWPEHDLRVTVSNPRDAASGLWAEVAVKQASLNGTGHIVGPLRVNLLEGRTRSDLANQLLRRSQGVRLDWFSIVETICTCTVRDFRQGAPVVRLRDVAPRVGGHDLLPALVPAGETSIWFGDGGAGKSLLLVAAGIAIAAGVPLWRGCAPTVQGPVLLLDYETTEDEQHERALSLSKGYGLPDVPADLHYRSCHGAFADEAMQVVAEAARMGVVAVLLDSLGFAAGAEPESALAATRTAAALRRFGPQVTRICSAHMTKQDAGRDQGRSRVFGSVFWENAARSVWEVRRSEETDADDAMQLGMYHRKVNRGTRRQPFGVHIEFENGLPARLTKTDLADTPDLAARVPLARRIRQALARGQLTTSELVEIVGGKAESVTAACRRLRDVRGDGGGGAGREATWRLMAWNDRA